MSPCCGLLLIAVLTDRWWNHINKKPIKCGSNLNYSKVRKYGNCIVWGDFHFARFVLFSTCTVFFALSLHFFIFTFEELIMTATDIDEVKEMIADKQECVVCEEDTDGEVYFCRRCYLKTSKEKWFCIDHGKLNHKKKDHSFQDNMVSQNLAITKHDMQKIQVSGCLKTFILM